MTHKFADNLGRWSKLGLALNGLWPGILDEVSRVCPGQEKQVLSTLKSRSRSVTRMAIHWSMSLVLFIAFSIAMSALTGIRLTGGSGSLWLTWNDLIGPVLFLTLMLASGVVLGWWWRRSDYRRLRLTLRKLGYPVCLRCGYLVRDRPVCPECGKPQIGTMD